MTCVSFWRYINTNVIIKLVLFRMKFHWILFHYIELVSAGQCTKQKLAQKKNRNENLMIACGRMREIQFRNF